MSPRTDLLLVSLGTTRGWRLADALFREQLERAGARTAAVGVRIGATNRLRRAYPVNDLVEALAARRAVAAALHRHGPRAVVVSTTTAAMLLPPLGVPFAVRLDAPAALNRPGARNAVLHLLERRWLGRAALVLPWSRVALSALPGDLAPGAARIGSAPATPSGDRAPGAARIGAAPATLRTDPAPGSGAPPGGGARAIVVPPPVAASGPPAPARERLAVAYTPDPKAKGLDVVCAAWAAAAVPEARLEVFGIPSERALAHLARRGVPEPPGVAWRGLTAPEAFRAALRRARLYVAGARWEDFGQAPLEALADGALLATVPSGGPFEALDLARRLEPSLVAEAVEPAELATCVRAAFGLDQVSTERYRAEAAELLAPYAPQAVAATVAREVLPALLSGP